MVIWCTTNFLNPFSSLILTSDNTWPIDRVVMLPSPIPRTTDLEKLRNNGLGKKSVFDSENRGLVTMKVIFVDPYSFSLLDADPELKCKEIFNNLNFIKIQQQISIKNGSRNLVVATDAGQLQTTFHKVILYKGQKSHHSFVKLDPHPHLDPDPQK